MLLAKVPVVVIAGTFLEVGSVRPFGWCFGCGFELYRNAARHFSDCFDVALVRLFVRSAGDCVGWVAIPTMKVWVAILTATHSTLLLHFTLLLHHGNQGGLFVVTARKTVSGDSSIEIFCLLGNIGYCKYLLHPIRQEIAKVFAVAAFDY